MIVCGPGQPNEQLEKRAEGVWSSPKRRAKSVRCGAKWMMDSVVSRATDWEEWRLLRAQSGITITSTLLGWNGGEK